MKKVLFTLFMLFGVCVMTAQSNVEKLQVNLNNGDVRHVLIDANKSVGFELISVYVQNR